MKKKWMAALCALALLLALALPATGVGETPEVYILAVNDKFCDLPGGALPQMVNGTLYVPYSVFDKSATGVDLGVYYGIGLGQSQGTTITLYSRSSQMLVFAISMGTCQDRDGNTMSFRGMIHNAVPYVPVAAVCSYFGLQYSFLPTSNRGTLIRVSNNAATMTDSQFLSAGAQNMSTRYNNILQSMEPSAGTTPAPSAPPSSFSPNGEKKDVRVYLAVDVSDNYTDLVSLIPDGVQALFLFSPDALPAQSALVRKAVAAGHSVGLKVGGTAEEALAQLERGNDLLTHIARCRTRMVSAPEELRGALSAEGWACWQPGLTGDATAILNGVDQARSVARVQLPGNAQVINRVLSQLVEKGYDLRQPLETSL